MLDIPVSTRQYSYVCESGEVGAQKRGRRLLPQSEALGAHLEDLCAAAVNAQGTLFKTGCPDLIEWAEQSMRQDEETRRRCMRCFTRRTFGLSWPEAAAYSARSATPAELRSLGLLLHDPVDSSNRWCSAVYLGEAVEGGSMAARSLLAGALRGESSRENLRALGLALNGERPWK